MGLAPGTSIGHYDVTALLGEGGMGQVWQATDTQLNRQVALKILPDAFAADPDRLARFTREAQILASLNHPNIAAIYGIEEAEGTRALVLELVEGPTLADRIAKGPIPLDEALPIAKQIAEALEAAHEAGVIHRDLKPANIKVREDGTVKVLDFGLAKALDPNPEGDPSQSPTLTAAATQMGVIMGTAAYMAPEQASGQPTDRRSDFWSFGVVVFEMLNGGRLFEADTASHVLAKVLEAPIDLDRLPDGTPPSLHRLVRRCLDREQRRRLRDATEALVHIEDAEAELGASAVGADGPARASQGSALRAVTVTAALTATVTGLTVWSLTRVGTPSAQPVRFGISAPAGEAVRIGDGTDLAISPDGRNVAYFTGDGGTFAQRQLRIRSLGEFDTKTVAEAEGLNLPFFSPNGDWVGYWSLPDQQLRRVSLVDGTVLLICNLPFDSPVSGASWGEDGTVVFSHVGRLWQSMRTAVRLSRSQPPRMCRTERVATCGPRSCRAGRRCCSP